MTKMWKPTKAGTYRLGGREIAVKCDCAGLYHEQSTNPELFGTPVKIHDHATWSLLAPDWQPGAPTVAQLERWQWWAFGIQSNGENSVVCGLVDHSSQFGLTQVGGCYYLTRTITRSTPVQPVPGEVLWVPLEVVNG